MINFYIFNRWFSCLIVVVVISMLASTAANAKTSISDVEKLTRLDTIIANLEESRQSARAIHDKADKYLRSNLTKTMIKGTVELWEWGSISSNTSKAVSATKVLSDSIIDAGKNVVDDAIEVPLGYWGYGTKTRVMRVSGLGADASERFVQLGRMYQNLQMLLQEKDIARYDSDRKPFQFTSRWWSPPDGKKDGWLQLLTRRLYVTREFSNKVAEVTGREIQVLKQERKKLAKNLPGRNIPNTGVWKKRYASNGAYIDILVENVTPRGVFREEPIEVGGVARVILLEAPGSRAKLTLTLGLRCPRESRTVDGIYITITDYSQDPSVTTYPFKNVWADCPTNTKRTFTKDLTFIQGEFTGYQIFTESYYDKGRVDVHMEIGTEKMIKSSLQNYLDASKRSETGIRPVRE